MIDSALNSEFQGNPDSVLKKLQNRLLDQCYKFSKHHLGSAFSTLPILVEIYEKFGPNDRFILSNGHAASALYVTLEHYAGENSDLMFESMGDHPKRDVTRGIYCSTGSLGMGLTVAVGMAMARKESNVFCLISDGECAEGSIWESLRYARRANLLNLNIFVNMNGWSAYDAINSIELKRELEAVFPRIQIRESNCFPFEEIGLAAHYIQLDEKLYLKTKEKLCAENL